MPRHGQWVKSSVLFPLPGNAAKSRDGLAVGIYVRYSEHPPGPFVQLVDKIGENLMMEVGGIWADAQLDPELHQIIPITDRRDIPEKRVAHLPPGWNPEP